jgi:hypothetical protein
MFRLPKSHHQAGYIHLKYYILACVHIMGSYIAYKLLKCIVFVVCCVGSGLWDGLITGYEEHYLVYIYVCI